MTALVLLLSLPCLYWTQGAEGAPAVKAAGIERVCVPPDAVDAWRGAGWPADAVSALDASSREPLPVPGITPRPGVASPTRAPWIVASGWRMRRTPGEKFSYEVPQGKAALAAAEAYAYGADAVLAIDPADLPDLGRMLAFLGGLPESNLPDVADLGVVDDGTPVTGEVMNLLTRRNLLFEILKAPASKYPITIAVGKPGYPIEKAADPSAFALEIRRKLTDARRSLRIYGSEVVVGRLTADGRRARLHLINYGGRQIDGLRIRVRGVYRAGVAHVAGEGRVPLEERTVASGTTEFTLPTIGSYAVIDLGQDGSDGGGR